MKMHSRVAEGPLRPYAIAGLLIAVVAMVLGLYCRLLGVHVRMFEAESGFFLEVVSTPSWVVQSTAGTNQLLATLINQNMFASYNGHFIPFSLMAELAQTRFFGTHESFWFWRQIIVLALLGAACIWFVHSIAKTSLSARWAAVASIGGCFFLFQPFLIEMLGWPFMALQFLVLTLTVLSASFFIRYVSSRQRADFAVFILLAYATMHMSGVGVAISGAALLTGGLVLFTLRGARAITSSDVRSCMTALVVGAVLTAGHAALMVRGAAKMQPVGEPLTLTRNAVRFGALIMDSVYAGVRSVWANGGFSWPRLDVQGIQAAYGFGVLAVMACLLVIMLSQYRRTENGNYLFGFVLTAYPFFALIIYTLLIVFRLREVAPNDELISYLIGGRYVIFPSFFLFLMGGAFWLVLFRVLGHMSSLLPVIFTVFAALASAVFVNTEMPRVWPHTQVDHEAEWNLIVRDVRADIAAGRPIRNRDLSNLDSKFRSDLRSKRYLLERELGCTGCVNILP